MNAVFDLLCFINLAKEGEMIADNLVNFKSSSVLSWIVPLHKRNTVWFILD